jgi:hypothetical protein
MFMRFPRLRRTARHAKREAVFQAAIIGFRLAAQASAGWIFLQASTEACDGSDGLVEHRLLIRIHVDVDDPLDAVGADHDRHTDVGVLEAVLPVR